MIIRDWSLIDISGLDSWFHQEELDRMGIFFEVMKNETKICTIKGYDFYKITLEKLTNNEFFTVEKALFTAGLYDLQISLTDQKQNISSRITTRDTTFKDEFKKIMAERTLVLDTNAMINRSISSLEFFAQNNISENSTIMIPRLVVLEMERIANSSSQQSNKQQKREVMMAYAELTMFKKNGATFLPELPRETLNDFTRISGGMSTDSWIRREIKDVAFQELTETNPQKFTLVTSDLINALSADAEDLPTIYISKLPYSDILTNILRKQVIRFLLMLSVMFEEITLKINLKPFIFRGIWEGKTTSDWISDVISYVNLPTLAKTISQDFDNVQTEEIVGILTIIKGELRTDFTRKYLTEKLDEIKQTSAQSKKLKLCKKLKPYLDWYLQG